jgi:hypothetical protein
MAALHLLSDVMQILTGNWLLLRPSLRDDDAGCQSPVHDESGTPFQEHVHAALQGGVAISALIKLVPSKLLLGDLPWERLAHPIG